jgi:hypothetical protein
MAKLAVPLDIPLTNLFWSATFNSGMREWTVVARRAAVDFEELAGNMAQLGCRLGVLVF